MKHIIFSEHAIKQMVERGASREEVIQTIRNGRGFLLSTAALPIVIISNIITNGVISFIVLNR